MGEEDPERESASATSALDARQAAAEQRAAARAERIAQQTGRSKVSAEALHARTAGAGWGFDEEAEAEVEADGTDELDGLSFEQLVGQAKAKGLNLSAKQERLLEQLERRSGKVRVAT